MVALLTGRDVGINRIPAHWPRCRGAAPLLTDRSLSNVVNTNPAVNHEFQHLQLGGGVDSSAAVDRAIRRRAAGRVGALGYAMLRAKVSSEGGGRVELISRRIDELSRVVVPDRRASPRDRSAYRRARRLTSWDVWAQAALAAEDLEIMLTGLLEWRSRGGDAFAWCRSVEARGPGFFEGRIESWPTRLSRIVHLPTAADLLAVLSQAEASLLAGGLANSIREAADNLYALATVVPWDVRLAMMSYKHGFRWLIPAAAPIATDGRGREILRSAPDTAFIVDTTDRSGMLFTASDQEIHAAHAAAQFSTTLETFVIDAILTEAENRAGLWGVALYGDSAADAAQQQLLARVVALIRRH